MRGMTLLELMIVVTIMAVLASIGVPMYRSALRSARITKATQELRIISQAIDAYRLGHDGDLPLTLHEVGHGGRRDPWGVPYCYLNYAAGTGDGLDWAISVGLVDPSAIVTGAGGAQGNGKGNGKGIGGTISTLASKLSGGEVSALVKSLKVAPVFVQVPVETVRRRDKYLFPLNTDYDLFSLGPDGRSAASLSHAMALDDVIRANDGGFFGTASDY